MQRIWLVPGVVLALTAAFARADITVPGADGSDGAFAPAADVQVDLPQAPTAVWNAANPNPGQGKGVYDAEKWAVVFRYSSVTIPAGVTVTFKNHPSRAPVVWLVAGDVTINGAVSLDGSDIHGGPNPSEPGPGGFRGGQSPVGGGVGSDGFGPGGAWNGTYAGGGSGTPYGNALVLPLIGGSGGAGVDNGWFYGQSPGAAGGGAILIAGGRTVSIAGQVRANGGLGNGASNSSCGSGGAVRLVADRIEGNGVLAATGGPSYGGTGRIRVEANLMTLADPGSPPFSFGSPGSTATIWPTADKPSVRAVSLAGTAISTDPRAALEYPAVDVQALGATPLTLVIEGKNVPPSWNMNVRVVPRHGAVINVAAAYVSGDVTLSRWEASLTLPAQGFAAIQVRASKPQQ